MTEIVDEEMDGYYFAWQASGAGWNQSHRYGVRYRINIHAELLSETSFAERARSAPNP